MVNNREDGPVGPGPTLDAGGDVGCGETPGRAYNSVQCLALLSCCFLFLTYSVAIDGTIGAVIIYASDMRRNDLNTLPSGSSGSGVTERGRGEISVRNGKVAQTSLTYGGWGP